MSQQRINFNGRSFSAIAQDHLLEWAGNPNFPDYMRVVYVAYGRHAANGHAMLERGELAAFLVRKNGTIPDRRQVWGAMDKAVRLGYLAEGSKSECLIVNQDHVQGGVGNPDARCPRTHKTRRRDDATPRSGDGRFTESVGNEDRHSAESVGDETGHSRVTVGDESRQFTLRPSISSTHRSASSGTPRLSVVNGEGA